jgi:ATP-dependent helicase HrpB
VPADDPVELPIAPRLPEIVRRLGDEGVLVLAAEPGAGKTSLVPPAIADALNETEARKVLVMEPRRLAAVGAAARIAEVWGKTLGDEVGYRVRGDSSTSPRARVEAITPGVLIRMIQDDPGLTEVGCVVLDEFHERSAQADLALALLAQSRILRPELDLLAMSATIDLAKTAKALGSSVLEVPGRSYPICTEYISPFPGDRPQGHEYSTSIAHAALDLLEKSEGDILIFLPGAAEIRDAVAAFMDIPEGQTSGRRYEAISLHGSLPLEAQRRVISPPRGAPRRAIFATSVAETSLTVPRVRAVLDSGLARFTRFEARTGLNRLVTEREAGDRADQRRGRAGRLGPGICVRAWSASEILSTRTEPEIYRAELSSLVLEAALWGCPRRLDLPWLDPPPEGAWSAGTELLEGLGALAPDLSTTPFGKRMSSLGTDPRLAALVLRGEEAGEAWTACLAAALLSDRGTPSLADLGVNIEELESGRRSASVFAEAERLARAVGTRPGRASPGALGPLLAAAFPDRIGERFEYRGTNASFRIPSGRSLRAAGSLAQSPWIVALDADAGSTEGKIYYAYTLCDTDARSALEAQVSESREIEWRGLEPKATLVRRAGAIVLGRRNAPRPGREELARMLATRIESEGLAILPWAEGAADELARLRFFAARSPIAAERKLDPASLSEESLSTRAGEWLAPFISDRGPALDNPSLDRAITSLAPRELRSSIEREAPRRIELPSGSSKRIDYSGQGGPFVEARVQELFGLSEQPRICGTALVFKLLDPGGKPLQVTSDLPGFWRGSWAEARKQLRGRYPKHEWPEDPASTAPSRSGIKKRRG